MAENTSPAVPQEKANDLNENEEGAKDEAIRRQVDFYFSVENLCRDRFLIGKMKGRKNRPVDLSLISSFDKMKGFGGVEVIAKALETSESVDVDYVDGKPQVKRKTPFIKDDYLDQWQSAQASQGAAGQPAPPVLPIRSKDKPTGFEPFFADAPITPMEHEENQALYDPDLPFAERIETALQRYDAKRKWHPMPRNIFTKFIMFGGVHVGPKQFTSTVDRDFLENHKAKEIARASSQISIADDKYLEGDDAQWQVSFERVAQAFLSTVMQDYFELNTLDKVEQCTNILINFYNYLLHHNVCPEYSEDIYAARRRCAYGGKEVFNTVRLTTFLPGPFNKACSVLSDGSQKAFLAVNDPWNIETEKSSDGEIAHHEQVFANGVSYINKRNGTQLETQASGYKVANEQVDIGLEVVSIEMASEPDNGTDSALKVEALGIMTCQPWQMPTFESEDLPPGISTSSPQALDQTYTFNLEDSLLEWFAIGMKLQADVRCLEDKSGQKITYLDAVTNVMCSFYMPLENELVRKWKEPQWITREQLWEKQKAAQRDEEEDAENRVDD